MSILARIRANGGDAYRDGVQVKVRRGRLSDDALAWLRRPDVQERLREEVWPEYHDWQERAAIREFDGGQDRATAEAEALREVLARC